jgi:hypothetical protein
MIPKRINTRGLFGAVIETVINYNELASKACSQGIYQMIVPFDTDWDFFVDTCRMLAKRPNSVSYSDRNMAYLSIDEALKSGHNSFVVISFLEGKITSVIDSEGQEITPISGIPGQKIPAVWNGYLITYNDGSGDQQIRTTQGLRGEMEIVVIVYDGNITAFHQDGEQIEFAEEVAAN